MDREDAAPIPLSDEEEAILQRLLTGELREEDDVARRALAASEPLRARFSDLQRLEGRLHRAGRERDEVLAESTRSAVDGEDEFLRNLRSRAAPGPNPRRTPMRVAVAAAALAAAALLIVWLRRDTGSSSSITLGAGDIQCVQPLGLTKDFTEWRWIYDDLPPGGRFEVRVYDAERAAPSEALLTSRLLRQPSWSPTEAELRTLPARIRYEIDAYDASAAHIASAGCEARRAP